jgi:hypothetical protein
MNVDEGDKATTAEVTMPLAMHSHLPCMRPMYATSCQQSGEAQLSLVFLWLAPGLLCSVSLADSPGCASRRSPAKLLPPTGPCARCSVLFMVFSGSRVGRGCSQEGVVGGKVSHVQAV